MSKIDNNYNSAFNNLSKDEQLVAHLGLVIKTLFKEQYELICQENLDNDLIDLQLKGISKDKKGGINYYNYMYSDAYRDEDKRFDKNGEIFAVLGIVEAIAKYGCANFGEFICPPQALAYIKEQREIGKMTKVQGIPDSHIPRDEARYENCKNACEAILRIEPALSGHPIMCLSGAFWNECNWKFSNTINMQEVNGGGNKGTAGYKGAGESWFGLTHWPQKERIIRGMNLPINLNSNYAPGNMIMNLSIDIQAKIVIWYLKNMVPQYGKFLLEFNSKKLNPLDVIAAGYLFKAGNFGKTASLWENALITQRIYNSSTGARYNGFALGIYMSMMFSKYMKENKVPKGEPWE